MTKFKITLRRAVTSYDELTRVIEADDETDAYNQGAELASEFNRSCPDDCAPSETMSDFIGGFSVEGAEPTDEAVDD